MALFLFLGFKEANRDFGKEGFASLPRDVAVCGELRQFAPNCSRLPLSPLIYEDRLLGGLVVVLVLLTLKTVHSRYSSFIKRRKKPIRGKKFRLWIHKTLDFRAPDRKGSSALTAFNNGAATPSTIPPHFPQYRHTTQNAAWD